MLPARQEDRVRKSHPSCSVACFAFLAVFASASAWADGCGAGVSPPLSISTVALRVLQGSLTPVPATDGYVHLAYAAQVTNINKNASTIQSIVPVDPANNFDPSGTNYVVDRSGNDVTGKVYPFKQFVPGNSLDAGGSGITFFDVRYSRAQDVPRSLSHRISVQPNDQRQATVETTDPIPVGCTPAVILSPPLTGPRWWNSNGCCGTVAPHRGAVLPVNGGIQPPEQFAIDFEQLTPARNCCTGPIDNLNSYPFFGAPVLAAADGVVVEVEDGLPEQVPGQAPQGVTIDTATGNHVIESIGGGFYVLYAHLKTGTIPHDLAQGSRLRRGQQIGGVGNTGNSTGPHLHFQVMDSPSALDTVGVPFVFDRQVLQGQVIGTDLETNTAYDSGQPLTVEGGSPALLRNLMPYEGQVFSYNP